MVYRNVGMTGVSYNGTLPNAVATTGVEGLKQLFQSQQLVVGMIIIVQMVQSLLQADIKEKIRDNMAEAVLTRKNSEVCGGNNDRTYCWTRSENG